MLQDRECSKTDPLSWSVIAIASLLWVVVLPISIREIQTKAKQNNTLKEVESESISNNSPVGDI
ncbi:MAG: hypothetical protein ACFCAD_07970 [Pleurocapsa sp.]